MTERPSGEEFPSGLTFSELPNRFQERAINAGQAFGVPLDMRFRAARGASELLMRYDHFILTLIEGKEWE